MRLQSRFPFVVVLAIVFAGCSASGVVVTPTDESPPYSKEYIDSIFDAAVFHPSEVQVLPQYDVDSLTVVSWVNSAFASAYPIGADTSYTFEIWVTVDPQVQERCRGFPQDSLGLRTRLQQYLGLPPEPNKERFFVTMRVASTDMFRACTNPALNTRVCTETAPEGVSDHHMAWVAKQMLASYTVGPDNSDVGYPWTRMGYTYDWNPNSPEVGAYEYVIPPDASKPHIVRILETASTASYCAPVVREGQ